MLSEQESNKCFKKPNSEKDPEGCMFDCLICCTSLLSLLQGNEIFIKFLFESMSFLF